MNQEPEKYGHTQTNKENGQLVSEFSNFSPSCVPDEFNEIRFHAPGLTGPILFSLYGLRMINGNG